MLPNKDFTTHSCPLSDGQAPQNVIFGWPIFVFVQHQAHT
jgi:hypothetical protein